MDIQIFGIQKSADTRKALRFFKERRVNVHFVDLKIRAASKGELTRFVQKFGVDGILDRDSKRFNALGLGRPTIPTRSGWRSWPKSPFS